MSNFSSCMFVCLSTHVDHKLAAIRHRDHYRKAVFYQHQKQYGPWAIPTGQHITPKRTGKVVTVALQFHGWGSEVKGGLLLILPKPSITPQRAAMIPASNATAQAGVFNQRVKGR